MASVFSLVTQVLNNRKQYSTAAMMILLGVGILTGQVDGSTVKVGDGQVTFENVDAKLAEGSAPVAPSNPNNFVMGLVTLLMGLNSAANRAAIAKSAAPRAEG